MLSMTSKVSQKHLQFFIFANIQQFFNISAESTSPTKLENSSLDQSSNKKLGVIEVSTISDDDTDDEDDDVSSNASTKPPESPAGNLFTDDEDEEEQIFITPPPVLTPNESESQVPKNESEDKSVGSVAATNNDDDDANDEPIETEGEMEIDDKVTEEEEESEKLSVETILALTFEIMSKRRKLKVLISPDLRKKADEALRKWNDERGVITFRTLLNNDSALSQFKSFANKGNKRPAFNFKPVPVPPKKVKKPL